MAASFHQHQFFSSLLPINKSRISLFSSSQSNNFSFLTFKNPKISSSNSEAEPEPNDEEDPIKLAFAKAKAYKNSTQSGIPTPEIGRDPVQEPYPGTSKETGEGPISDELEDGVGKDVPLAVKYAFERAKEYKNVNTDEETAESGPKIVQKAGVTNSADERVETNNELKPSEAGDDGGGTKEVPVAVKLALEKAKEYKKNKEDVTGNGGGVGGNKSLASGLGGNEKSPADKQSIKSSSKKGELSVSSIDFMGLGFSDKKSGRSLPAGLVPQSDPFSEGELPEVEIIVGDMSKFGDAAASSAIPTKEDDADLYKPKVSTWGVFPRPNDISKTYGGGRNIRPGEALESAEVKAVKEARTRKLVAAYKSRIGLNLDPKLKSECEKALKDGDSLMDLGNLKDALPFYEKVMEKLAFQNELHGLAALQWSICQDSLGRPDEARVMYEKLHSHPSPGVSKKARQFSFSFQAMEMMKVSSSTRSPVSTGYQNYFEAFVEDKPNYPLKEAQVDEDGLNQALPYVLFLASPIVMVLLIAASKFQ